MVEQIALAVVAAIVIVGWKLVERLGWLPERPSLKHFREQADASERAVAQLRDKVADLERVNRKLEQERSNAPILEQLAENARLQTMTLEKLASFNGTLAAMQAGLETTNDSLRETREAMHTQTEAIKFLAGQIVSDYASQPRPPEIT